MKIKLTRNQQGELQISQPPYLKPFADFLETDINENQEYCQEIISSIDEIKHSSNPNQQEFFCGNIYELEINPKQALLLNLYDDRASPVKIELNELKELLSVWQKEISKHSSQEK